MMSNSTSHDWEVEGLRHSTFVQDPLNIWEISPWSSLFGTTAEERTTKKAEQLVKEEGPYSAGWLSVEARANRIDWRLGPDPRSVPQPLSAIGAYNQVQNTFLELMKIWSATCGPIQRLAYGATLLLARNSPSDTYSTINKLLHNANIDLENTQDFMYRINRRRTSQILDNSIQINRLSTWSILEYGRVKIDIRGGNSLTLGDLEKKQACRLDLDINTAAEFQGRIDSTEAVILTEELFAFATEIASEGDVR